MSEETEVHQSIEELRTFVARRFDEISMEINATSQLLDMAEEDASKRFGEIFETMQAISHKGDGLTPANSGVELEAVVAETEQAANTIMDAVDIISVGIAEKMREEHTTEDTKQFLNEINTHLQAITLACSFQDLVSQRIRKTVENLENVEGKLNDTLTKMGLPMGNGEAAGEANGAANPDSNGALADMQAQIQPPTPAQGEAVAEEEDTHPLEKELNPQTSSQADIDALFD